MRINFMINVLLCCLLYSCINSKAPDGWLPDEREAFAYNSFGGYLFLRYMINKEVLLKEKKDINEEFLEKVNEINSDSILVENSGEFLGMKRDSVVFINSQNSIFIIHYKDIEYIQLELDERQSGLYGFLGVLMFFTTPFLNGKYSVFTGPITLFSTIGATSFEENRDVYYEFEPEPNWFNQITPYARFPQGITNEIDMSKLLFTYKIHYQK